MLLLLLLLKVRILWKIKFSQFSHIFSHERNWNTNKLSILTKLIFWSILTFKNWSFAKIAQLFCVSSSRRENLRESKELLFHKIRTWRTGCTWDLVEDFLDKSLAFRNSMDFDFCNFRVFSCSGFKVLSMLLPLKEK